MYFEPEYLEPGSAVYAPPAGALRVLVVDDETDALRTLLAILRLERMDARGIPRPDDALPAVRDFNPDAVILDINLGRVSGWQVARDIRAETTPSRPLLIALSGMFTRGADRVLSELAGFNYYMIKPYDPNVLIALLENAQWSQRVGKYGNA